MDNKVWASRKIARRIARANMRRAGVAHPNKARYAIRGGMFTKLPSFFSSEWRNYL